MNSAAEDHILCRLHLNAVLYAFEDFMTVVPEAKQILGKTNFSISISTRSQLNAVIKFENGCCEFMGANDNAKAIKMVFLSERQLNHMFNQSGFAFPLITRGCWRIKQLIIFKHLSTLFTKYVQPDANTLEDSAFRAKHLKILFGIILAATKELGENEETSRQLIKATPEGLAYLTINDCDITGWIQWKGGKINHGKGAPPHSPDVKIIFEDSNIALAAFRNKIINMAEIGLGSLRIEGDITLAERLGLISDRISLYLNHGN